MPLSVLTDYLTCSVSDVIDKLQTDLAGPTTILSES